MIKLLHLNYHCHREFSTPFPVIEKHKFSTGFIDHIARQVHFLSVKHLNHYGALHVAGIDYHFFKSRNRSWHIPFRTHRFITKENPDVVLVEGFVFPLQVIFLRWKLGRKTVIMEQHHGEKPWTGIKGWLQKLADRFVDAYLFTSLGNAEPWLQHVIRKKDKCFEILSASTLMKPHDREDSRNQLGFKGTQNFLWVGRLIDIKDPLTILKGFAAYCRLQPMAKLYMIFQSDELLSEVELLIRQDSYLRDAVILCGKKNNTELSRWYSAADFFLSGSKSEGSGYALVEAMTCGCIPVVTDIPSFRKITSNGTYGFLFQPGNVYDLLQQLSGMKGIDKEIFSDKIKTYSQEELSCDSISNQITQLSHRLVRK